MSASAPPKGNSGKPPQPVPQFAGQPVRLDVGSKASAQKASSEPSPVVILLRVEGEARAARTLAELAQLIANETRKLTRAQQVFVLRKTATGTLQIEAASAMPSIDRHVPLMQWLERTVARADADAGLSSVREFTLYSYGDASDPLTLSYPFREALWFPLIDRTGALFAGALLLRSEPWATGETALVQRLSVTFAQAWYWISTTKAVRPKFQISRKRAAASVLLAAVVCLFPVAMTTLAPFEIGAREPSVVTAPIDGVIQDIPIAPNSIVAPGDVLVRFADTVLRNRLEVAERELQVADARIKKNMLLAMTDIRGRHELALARSELTVKTAERDYARDLLERAQITATRPGIAIFGDKRDLLGKPISTGERIMEIADPAQVEIRIDVPVADSIILSDDKRAKVFLDSDPLRPREATIVHGDYQAKMREGGSVAFRVVATFADGSAAPPRLGIRGTAQLYGDRVPLLYYILRRPVAFVRQWVGL
jgi:hypothetical protein